jgi:hypothetical protein
MREQGGAGDIGMKQTQGSGGQGLSDAWAGLHSRSGRIVGGWSDGGGRHCRMAA